MPFPSFETAWSRKYTSRGIVRILKRQDIALQLLREGTVRIPGTCRKYSRCACEWNWRYGAPRQSPRRFDWSVALPGGIWPQVSQD